MKVKFLPCLFLAIGLSFGVAMCASADIVAYTGITVPEHVIYTQPEATCGFDDASACRLGAGGNFTYTVPGGATSVNIQSAYSESIVPYTGDIMAFRLYINGELIVRADDTPSTANIFFQDPLGYAATDPGTNHYLGGQFVIDGQTYYDWTEFNYNFGDGDYPPRLSDVPTIVIGLGYETCPNVPITLGATSGGATCANPLNPPGPPATPTTESSASPLLVAGIVGVLYFARVRKPAIVGK